MLVGEILYRHPGTLGLFGESAFVPGRGFLNPVLTVVDPHDGLLLADGLGEAPAALGARAGALGGLVVWVVDQAVQLALCFLVSHFLPLSFT